MSELALLVDRWRDEELSPEERAALFARLERDADFARAFADEQRFRGQLGGLLGGADPEQLWRRVDALVRATTDTGRHRFADRVEARVAARPRAARRPRTAWWPMVAVAAAVLAVAISLTLYAPRDHEPDTPTPPIAVASQPRAEPPLATIASCSGAASLAGAPAHAGDGLRRGQTLRLGADATAQVLYEDGSRLDVVADSALVLADENGAKRVELARGSVSASVSKQPTGRAMRLATPEAIATVVGTRFTLGTIDGATDLAVSEGRVACALIAGGAAVEVAAGESAHVEAGAVAKRDPPSAGYVAVAAALPLIMPHADEDPWDRLDWSIDLWAARGRAAAAGRPVLLWAAWGHPLGMSAVEGLRQRAEIWSDPETLRLAQRFVPVAADTWYLTRRRDAVGAFFAELVAKLDVHSTTHDGIYCFDAAGAFLGACATDHPVEEVRALLVAAMAQAAPASAPIPDAGTADAEFAPQLPPEALRADVAVRALTRQGASWNASGAAARDHLWLTAAEWRQLLPEHAQVGARLAFPPEVARKIARFHFVDCTRSEAVEWEEDQVRALALELVVEEARGDHLRLRIEGSARLAARSRGYEPTIAGALVAEAGRIVAFDLVAIGEHWGDDSHDGSAQSTRRPLGIAIRLAGDRPRDFVPPHGLRDKGYLGAR